MKCSSFRKSQACVFYLHLAASTLKKGPKTCAVNFYYLWLGWCFIVCDARNKQKIFCVWCESCQGLGDAKRETEALELNRRKQWATNFLCATFWPQMIWFKRRTFKDREMTNAGQRNCKPETCLDIALLWIQKSRSSITERRRIINWKVPPALDGMRLHHYQVFLGIIVFISLNDFWYFHFSNEIIKLHQMRRLSIVTQF